MRFVGIQHVDQFTSNWKQRSKTQSLPFAITVLNVHVPPSKRVQTPWALADERLQIYK